MNSGGQMTRAQSLEETGRLIVSQPDTTSKFAVVGMTKALALDQSHTGVQFNCICPGRVETPFVLARLKEYPDPQAAYRDIATAV